MEKCLRRKQWQTSFYIGSELYGGMYEVTAVKTNVKIFLCACMCACTHAHTWVLNTFVVFMKCNLSSYTYKRIMDTYMHLFGVDLCILAGFLADILFPLLIGVMKICFWNSEMRKRWLWRILIGGHQLKCFCNSHSSKCGFMKNSIVKIYKLYILLLRIEEQTSLPVLTEYPEKQCPLFI